MKYVWLDILCREAVVLTLKRIESVDVIYYNHVLGKPDPFIKQLKQRFQCSVEQIAVSYPEQRFNGMSMHQAIELRMFDVLKQYVVLNDVHNIQKDFISKHDYQLEHIQGFSQWQLGKMLYKRVELKTLSETIPGQHCFIFRENGLGQINADIFSGATFLHYKACWSHRKIKPRRDYRAEHIYYRHFVQTFWFVVLRDFTVTLYQVFWNFFLLLFFKKALAFKPSEGVRVGVEMIQPVFDRQHELHWLDNQVFDRQQVVSFELTKYDNISHARVAGYQINRVTVPCHIVSTARLLLKKCRFNQSSPVTSTFAFTNFEVCIQRLKNALAMLMLLLRRSDHKCLRYLNFRFRDRALFWMGIYEQANVKVLLSFVDSDIDRHAKRQALKKCHGVTLTAHWSNFSFSTFIVQKHTDVFFTWGESFKAIFRKHTNLDSILSIGYPNDVNVYYVSDFVLKKKSALKNKFVISYFDNLLSYDNVHSPNYQEQMMMMFHDLLEKYSHLVVMIKTKKIQDTEMFFRSSHVLRGFFDSKRLLVFPYRGYHHKIFPHEVGQISDLVLGLGISTAAAECFFGGIKALHLDLTHIKDNPFVEQALNKVVFQNMDRFQSAVQEYIEGRGLSWDAMKKYYQIIEPFMDGQSTTRLQEYVSALCQQLNQGDQPKTAIERANHFYQNKWLMKSDQPNQAMTR